MCKEDYEKYKKSSVVYCDNHDNDIGAGKGYDILSKISKEHDMKVAKRKKRFTYTILTFLLLAVEVVIALFVKDNFIRPYIGDVLVVIVLYTFARIFVPEGMKYLSLYILVFAIGVEVLQYFQIVRLLGLEGNVFLRVLIGSVFDWKDIFCYAVGYGILNMVGIVVKNITKF